MFDSLPTATYTRPPERYLAFKTKEMEEIEIKIIELKSDMQELTIMIDNFSRHGRTPFYEERFKQISLLDDWRKLDQQLKACEEILNTIKSNNLCAGHK